MEYDSVEAIERDAEDKYFDDEDSQTDQLSDPSSGEVIVN